MSEVPSCQRELEGAGERRRTNDQNASIVGQKVCGQCSDKYTFCRHGYMDITIVSDLPRFLKRMRKQWIPGSLFPCPLRVWVQG